MVVLGRERQQPRLSSRVSYSGRVLAQVSATPFGAAPAPRDEEPAAVGRSKLSRSHPESTAWGTCQRKRCLILGRSI
ncbi:hypothetical protein MC885_001619 [Smutsia gigantea]|nr:hypothetical protein MC885_001619 [Smutsia gigantea]